LNKQISRVTVVALVLLAALIVGTTYWQAWGESALSARQDNAIQRVAQFTVRRGLIYAADGSLLAGPPGGEGQGPDVLLPPLPGRGPRSPARRVLDPVPLARRAGTVDEFLSDSVQLAPEHGRAAHTRPVEGNDRHRQQPRADAAAGCPARGAEGVGRKLRRRRRARAEHGPRTGDGIHPDVQPEPRRGTLRQISRSARNAKCGSPAPLVNRATDGLFVPGSTFKIVTAAAALDSGAYTASSTFDDKGYCEEYGKRVSNFSDQSGPEVFGHVDFTTALEHSINAVFCEIGKKVGR
jgi:peptidoglycan glycosyltransferase